MTIKKQHTKAYLTFVERYKEVSRDIPWYIYYNNFGALQDAEIVKSIVISWLSEKSFITSSAKQKRID
jgi:hypothetical protein